MDIVAPSYYIAVFLLNTVPREQRTLLEPSVCPELLIQLNKYTYYTLQIKLHGSVSYDFRIELSVILYRVKRSQGGMIYTWAVIKKFASFLVCVLSGEQGSEVRNWISRENDCRE